MPASKLTEASKFLGSSDVRLSPLVRFVRRFFRDFAGTIAFLSSEIQLVFFILACLIFGLSLGIFDSRGEPTSIPIKPMS